MSSYAFRLQRPINIAITGAFDPNGYKALVQKIEDDFETRIANGETIATILPGSEIFLLCSGKNEARLYIFSMSADFDAGNYVVAFEEVVANVASATVLP